MFSFKRGWATAIKTHTACAFSSLAKTPSLGAAAHHHQHPQPFPHTGERAFDIYSRLLRERIICVNGPIDDSTSNVIIAQLLYLESQHPEKPVRPPPSSLVGSQ